MFENRTILKYVDDSVIVSLLRDTEASHGPVIEYFVRCCEDSYLQLNISKTKDMIMDFRKNCSTPDATNIKGQIVEYEQVPRDYYRSKTEL